MRTLSNLYPPSDRNRYFPTQHRGQSRKLPTVVFQPVLTILRAFERSTDPFSNFGFPCGDSLFCVTGCPPNAINVREGNTIFKIRFYTPGNMTVIVQTSITNYNSFTAWLCDGTNLQTVVTSRNNSNRDKNP